MYVKYCVATSQETKNEELTVGIAHCTDSFEKILKCTMQQSQKPMT